jgi:asparagine synthase (glutamine-hydrolysing)
MCGIFGWVSARAFNDGPQRLSRALEMLTHRGPDGEGQAFHRTAEGFDIALGHRRLSIIDLSEAGAQPFASDDGRLVVTFNGEIYNFIELREDLRAKGHRFRTQSDTEVLVEAYRAWGAECLTRLRGMYAFALYDADDQSLLLARDPFGKKPLFLRELDDGFAFSSEIPPLLDLPGPDAGLDDEVMSEYLLRRYVTGPATFFKGVRKLNPGHYLVWKQGKAAETRFYTPPFATTASQPLSFGEALESFSATLDEAVRIRMRSDAPFGAFLSGGLDSSVVVALMARHSSGPVATFSVGFAERDFSELRHARRVAERFGAKHDELVVTPEAFEEAWLDAVAFRAAPESETSDIPILMLSRHAGASVKMVLTGEGADELLAGYPKYLAERFVGTYQAMVPQGVHNGIVDPAVRHLPYGARRLKILSAALAERTLEAREACWFASCSPQEVCALLGRAPPPGSSRARDLQTVHASSHRCLQLSDQLAWLPDNLLERADRMMMAGSVEGRMPFMDTELAALVARFPDRFFARGQGKHVLREFAKPLLDQETIMRSKVGFRVPVGEWFRTCRRDLIRDLLASGESRIRKILNVREIDRLISEHLAGRHNHERPLWTLANLEVFVRRFGLALPCG